MVECEIHQRSGNQRRDQQKTRQYKLLRFQWLAARTAASVVLAGAEQLEPERVARGHSDPLGATALHFQSCMADAPDDVILGALAVFNRNDFDGRMRIMRAKY